MAEAASKIQIVAHHHGFYSHGDIVSVTDNVALANKVVVTRDHARAMVMRGEAAWVSPAVEAAARKQAEAAAEAAAREEQARKDAAVAERKRELAALFDRLPTSDRDVALRRSVRLDAERRRSQREQFDSLPVDDQEAVLGVRRR